MKTLNFNSSRPLLEDDLFPKTEVLSLQSLSGVPVRRGLEKAIISGGQLVNVVSDSYGHLDNRNFFGAVENALINADLDYKIQSINRDNRSFAADYILNDSRYTVTAKNSGDEILPMLRFVNSYDGSCKTSGSFGFFRKVCTNGLHVATEKIGFSVKHRGEIADIVLPEIAGIVRKFVENEYYSLTRKFESMTDAKISDVQKFVKEICDKTALFKFESSDKNPDPSLNARMVIDTIYKESRILNEKPNFWLGYNAFNEIIHGKLKKPFEQQKALDSKIFNLLAV